MFRENVLVRDDIIERIAGTMIPLALDYQKVINRRSKESQFLLPLMKKKKGDKQGVWIFSPKGKVLGGPLSGFGNMVQKTKGLVENALRHFGPVTARKRNVVATHPYRGKGVKSDGSVCLAEYVRRRDGKRIRSPVISSVVLSKKDFKAFAPEKVADGAEWTLPNSVAKRLCRIASPMCYQHAPQPDWVKSVTLKARIRTIRNGVAELLYEGQMSSERIMRNGKILSEQELTLKGEGVYDIGAGRMQSLLIVGSGTFRWPEEAPSKTVLFDALVEWDVDSPESTISSPAPLGANAAGKITKPRGRKR
ncbi:MAG: hypothetical protein O7D32_02030 [bacterium]|nr:hypothetical protein [bacterium]